MIAYRPSVALVSSAILLFLSSSWQGMALAQPPAPDKPVALINGETNGTLQNKPGNMVVLRTTGTVGQGHSWLIFPRSAEASFLGLRDISGEPCGVFALNEKGKFIVILAVALDNQVAQAAIVIDQGDPEPPPDPDPDPDPDPPEAGKRLVLLIYESGNTTPAFSRLTISLRNAPHADYIRSKGHGLSILDDDVVDENDQPSPVLASWRPHFAEMQLPVVFIVDQNTGKLVHKQELPASATAGDVMKILKDNGG